MFSLKNKKVAIFGMGISGLSALRFVCSLEASAIAINSGSTATWAKSPGVLDFVSIKDCFSENDPELFSKLNQVDLVILSPGIPRDHAVLKPLHLKKIPIWGEIELAYRFLEEENALVPMIGITGTNGKTTSTTFLGEMIKASGKKVFVGGNIGVPFCDYAYDVLKNNERADIILLELSSFQLESIERFHLNIAIILNLYQNHGERYASIEDYGRSKFFITNRFTDKDVLIYPEDFKIIRDWADTVFARKYAVNTAQPKIDYDTSEFKLPGLHNLVNLAFILKAAEELKLSNEAIVSTISSFKGVHHRIEYVSDLKGLNSFRAYNDAKSTNWDATLTAVKAMEDFKLPIHLIIGGKKRGHGDSILPHLDYLKEKVAYFYLIGEMADELEAELRGKVDFKKTKNLESTFLYLKSHHANDKGILLFSPAFPSFDQFKDYADRGRRFVALAQGH